MNKKLLSGILIFVVLANLFLLIVAHADFENEANKKNENVLEIATNKENEVVLENAENLSDITNIKAESSSLMIKTSNIDKIRQDEDIENITAISDELFIIEYKDEKIANEKFENLSNQDLIEEVAKDFKVNTLEIESSIQAVPKDYYSWGRASMGIDHYLDYLNYQEKKEILVAVLDTGINPDHEAFTDVVSRDRLDLTYAHNFAYEADDENYTDENGHGTMVASIIAQTTPSNVKIVPIKVMGADGGGYVSDTIRAINYIKDKVDIINLSLGTDISDLTQQEYEEMFATYNESLEEFYDNGNGPIIIAASGNDGVNRVSFPACNPRTIGISALEKDNMGNVTFSDYSNYGPEIDFSAPGTSISIANYETTDGYYIGDGTSFATPHVSSAVALLKSEYSLNTFDEVMGKLQENCEDLGETGKDIRYGYGSVNFITNKFEKPVVANVTQTDGGKIKINCICDDNIVKYVVVGEETDSSSADWKTINNPSKSVEVEASLIGGYVNYKIYFMDSENEISMINWHANGEYLLVRDGIVYCMYGSIGTVTVVGVENDEIEEITIPDYIDYIHVETIEFYEGEEDFPGIKFQDCHYLKKIEMSDSIRCLKDNIFGGCNENLELVVTKGLYAENYASKHGINYSYNNKREFYDGILAQFPDEIIEDSTFDATVKKINDLVEDAIVLEDYRIFVNTDSFNRTIEIALYSSYFDGALGFSALAQKSVSLIDKYTAYIIPLIPNDMELDIKENEYETANTIIAGRVSEILQENEIEANIIVDSLTLYSDGSIYKAVIRIDNNQTKTINLTYSNSNEKENEKVEYAQRLSMENPKYYEVENVVRNMDDFIEIIKNNYASAINEANITIKVEIPSGGGSLLGVGADNVVVGIFIDDILYDVRNMGPALLVPIFSIPDDVPSDTWNSYLINEIRNSIGDEADSITKITRGAVVNDFGFSNLVIKGGYTVNCGSDKDYIIVRKPETIEYATHAEGMGWQKYASNGNLTGTSSGNLILEAIKIKLSEDNTYSGSVTYQTHIPTIGWEQEWMSDDDLSGTLKRGLCLDAIRVRLTGEIAEYYDIYYRVNVQDIGWLDWSKNGEDAGALEYGKRLEGIEIKLVVKGEDDK